MTKMEAYMNAARKFSPDDQSALPGISRKLIRWVEEQRRAISDLGAPDRLRCLAYVTMPMRDGKLLRREFVGPGRRRHTITIASSGSNHITGREPHTVGLNASITLLGLLPKASGVAVTLQPCRSLPCVRWSHSTGKRRRVGESPSPDPAGWRDLRLGRSLEEGRLATAIYQPTSEHTH